MKEMRFSRLPNRSGPFQRQTKRPRRFRRDLCKSIKSIVRYTRILTGVSPPQSAFIAEFPTQNGVPVMALGRLPVWAVSTVECNRLNENMISLVRLAGQTTRRVGENNVDSWKCQALFFFFFFFPGRAPRYFSLR